MGIRDNLECTRYLRDHRNLIHLLWTCSKLHLYWTGVVNTINRVFHVGIPIDPRPCLLGILDDPSIEDIHKQAIGRVLFQARRLIFRHWKATECTTLREWMNQIGDTLRLEKYIFNTGVA